MQVGGATVNRGVKSETKELDSKGKRTGSDSWVTGRGFEGGI